MPDNEDAVKGPPEELFDRAWNELCKRLEIVREDLGVAERRSLGEETRRGLEKKLNSLEEIARQQEMMWTEFEKRLRELEKLLD